ncbi:MAG: hypothetical protein LUF89_00885 [Ruminococcus sp.]|nr:hypothetical protein [Ruminococcus sp.]
MIRLVGSSLVDYTCNSTNLNIRKVHNDKFDSKKLALIALKPDLKTSVIPSDLVLNIRNLVREYYRLKDERTAYVTNVKLSKRGSRLARRVLHMMALNNIAIYKNGALKNPVLRSYYEMKCISKPKMVALSAVTHKLCNIIFAILRDNKAFEIVTPEQHNLSYYPNQLSAA